jgi:hypothetical protein
VSYFGCAKVGKKWDNSNEKSKKYLKIMIEPYKFRTFAEENQLK